MNEKEEKEKTQAIFGPEIERYKKRMAEHNMKARKRDEEMFSRHVKNYMEINFSQVDNKGIRQYDFPYWCVRNEIPPPRDGVDPQEWARRQGKKAKDMGIRSGVYDWHFLLNKVFHVIELKIKDGSVSQNQRHFGNDIRRQGGKEFVAWSMNEFHQIIISCGLNPKVEPGIIDVGSKKLLLQNAYNAIMMDIAKDNKKNNKND